MTWMNLRIVERANQLLEDLNRRDMDSVDKMSKALAEMNSTQVKIISIKWRARAGSHIL